MTTAYRDAAKLISEIEPLIKNDGERMENHWQRQRSEKVIQACRPASTADWLSKGLLLGALLGITGTGLSVPLAMWIPKPYGQPTDMLMFVGVTTFVSIVTMTALFMRRGRLIDRRETIGALAPGELEWHRCWIETNHLAYLFDTRLKALKDYAANATDEASIGADTLRRCIAERSDLDGRLRALRREDAVRRLGPVGYVMLVENRQWNAAETSASIEQTS